MLGDVPAFAVTVAQSDVMMAPLAEVSVEPVRFLFPPFPWFLCDVGLCVVYDRDKCGVDYVRCQC